MRGPLFARSNWDTSVFCASCAVILLAALVLIGWHTHIRMAVQLFPGMVPMQYNSALCFMALGVGGLGLTLKNRWLSSVAGIAAFAGLLVILEYAYGRSFGIDTLFFLSMGAYSVRRSRPDGADDGDKLCTFRQLALHFCTASRSLCGPRYIKLDHFKSRGDVVHRLLLSSHVRPSIQFRHADGAAYLACISVLQHCDAWVRVEVCEAWDGWAAAMVLGFRCGIASGVSGWIQHIVPGFSWQSVSIDVMSSFAGVVFVGLAIRWLTTAKVAYKGLMMIAVPLVQLLIFIGLVTHLKHRNESAIELTQHSNEVIDVSETLLAHITERESSVRGYIITRDASFIGADEKLVAAILRAPDHLLNLVSDNPDQTARGVRIKQLTTERMDYLTEIIRVLHSNDLHQIEEAIKVRQGVAIMEQIRAEMSIFLLEEGRLSEVRRHALDTSWHRLSWLLVSGTSAAILLASFFTLSFSGSISRRLRQLQDNATSLAAGEAIAPPLAGYDEIADLDRVFHGMADTLDRATRGEKAIQVMESRAVDVRHTEALLKAGALQNAIFNSANFSSIATDATGVIQIFNVGAERMLGYAAKDVMNKITPADISDPQEVIVRAKALSIELGTSITPGFEALVFKASRGIEDIYELTYIRKDGSRFPAVVSVTALRDPLGAIIGYLLIGTDNTARKLAEEALLKAGALQNAIFNSANFSSIATDANGVIQIFNVGAERMLGYAAAEVTDKITPADISDPGGSHRARQGLESRTGHANHARV